MERRATEAERRLAQLEKSHKQGGEEKKKDKNEGEERKGAPSDLERAEYRVQHLLKTLATRDEELKHAQEELAKRDYQVMHLKRAYDAAHKA